MTELSLINQWEKFKKDKPNIRIRDAAFELNTSEMALVATQCGKGNIRLRPDFKGILESLNKLGDVMALTRSDHAVHEAHGTYQDMKIHGSVALFFNPGVDARFFLDKWEAAYAVNENDRHSIQFFDKEGVAVHKVYVTKKTKKKAYQNLINTYTSDYQETFIVSPQQALNDEKINDEVEEHIDPASLRESWLAIQDVHEANSIIKSYGQHRRDEIYQALGKDLAQELPINSVEKLLTMASEKSVEIMVFVMNDAAVQSYSGSVKELLRTGPWFNVLDPQFNLHLRTDGIGKIWLIRKPTKEGWVTTIDVLDTEDTQFLLISDNRKRGEMESSEWQDLCYDLL